MKPRPSFFRQFPPNTDGKNTSYIASRCCLKAWLLAAGLLCAGTGMALAEPVEIGRLFYTPAQRAQLETARARNITQRIQSNNPSESDRVPAPQRFDGVIIRSDGKTTRWIDGKPEVGPSSVQGLKPGQIRANGKVYEPYQVLRPTPPGEKVPGSKEPTP